MMTTTPNPTEAQIEKAARAFFREYHGEDIWPEIWDDGELDTRSRALAATRAALAAAGVAPQPVIDEAALAEVIADAPHSGDPNVSCLDPRCKAAAVAAWLREGVAPQEPSRLPDFFAPKPMPNSYVPAPVLPSSGVDEDALAEAWEAGCLAGRNRKHHTNMTEEQAEKAWPNPYRAGDGESRG